MAEADAELEGNESGTTDPDTVEENALEKTSEPLLEENDESIFGEDLEGTPVSNEEVEEVLQDTSTPVDENAEGEKELSEYFEDQTEKSFDKTAQIVDEEDEELKTESVSDNESVGSEKEEVNEEFTGDDEIIEEDHDDVSVSTSEQDDDLIPDESENETETIEDSNKTQEDSVATGEIENPLQEGSEDMELEHSKDDEVEEISPMSVEVQEAEDLSATSEFHEELKNAMENAIKENPNAKTIMVIKYDKDDTHPSIQHVDVDDYKEEFYERQEHKDQKTVEEILSQSMTGGNGEDILPALDGPILEGSILDDTRVSDQLKEEAQTIIEPTGEAKGTVEGILNGSITINPHEMANFENVSLQDALNDNIHHHTQNTVNGHVSNHLMPNSHGPKIFKKVNKTDTEMTKSEQVQEAGENAKEVYLSSHEKMHNALKLFAEHDALKRATVKIPKGIPSNVFLADFMGVSGIGEHKPSYNMIKYYGGLSEFNSHFAEKAKRQISFEDIDTLIGLISDVNGIFTTIYDLLPSKDEVENEKESSPGKSVLDHAYDILRFYSQVRGFINTIVFNRHLIIQDIKFIKSRVNDLHTDIDDMLYFYSFDEQYLKVKTRGARFHFDPKIEAFLKRIDNISAGFGVDVKKILRTFFHLEKAVIFFDNDTRLLATSINVTTPLDAIRTVDSVIMYIIRIIELKVDIFKSMTEFKTALENLAKYRSEIIDNLNGAEQIIHYYTLKEESAGIWKMWMLVMVLFVYIRRE